jgi:hypothetical protein
VLIEQMVPLSEADQSIVGSISAAPSTIRDMTVAPLSDD